MVTAQVKSKETAQKPKSAIEKSLELAVFGNEDFFDNLAEESSDQELFLEHDATKISDSEDFSKLEDAQLFVIDGGEDDVFPDVPTDENAPAGTAVDDREPFIPAWYDSDDEKLAVSLASRPILRKLRYTETEDVITGPDYIRRLRTQFERTYPRPEWAQLGEQSRKRRRRNSDSSAESDTDEQDREIALSADPLKSLFRSSQRYTKAQGSQIRKPGKLSVRRLRDANHQSPAHCAIQTLSFHPHFPLLMTGGYDRTLRIYHIDGNANTPVASLHLRGVSIERAEFHPDGRRIFISGQRRYFHVWDLESGAVEKFRGLDNNEGLQTIVLNMALSKSGDHIALVGNGGWVNILSSTTGQWIDGFKVTKSVSDLAWHHDDNLTVSNHGAEIWQYNLNERRVILRWNDEGGMDTTRIALGGPRDRWLAVGSKSGIVNIYDRAMTGDSQDSPPKLVKTLKQLTTSVHDLRFNNDGQILAMSSRAKKDSLKLVHLPSATVFQNWPTQTTPLGRIGATAFSPGAEFAVGNEAGRVTLWRF